MSNNPKCPYCEHELDDVAPLLMAGAIHAGGALTECPECGFSYAAQADISYVVWSTSPLGPQWGGPMRDARLPSQQPHEGGSS